MKKFIRKQLGDKYVALSKNKKKVTDRINLVLNFLIDLRLFYKHSNVFSLNSFEKLESKIILDYHGLEKGFLHKDIRPRFAKERVVSLLKNLKKIECFKISSNQVAVSKAILKKYYLYHQEIGVDIADYFPKCEFLNINGVRDESPIISLDNTEYFRFSNLPFNEFSISRRSIRSFKKALIDPDILTKVIDLARHAPSVCNRQPSKIYYTNNYEKVQSILNIQGGMTGYKENINQLMVVTVDRSYFYTVGERNQFYIDGGIFLMNLLYSLHFFGIAACCANWGKEFKDDKKIANILNLSPSEKVICVVVMGYSENSVKFTLSKRREGSDIFRIVD